MLENYIFERSLTPSPPPLLCTLLCTLVLVFCEKMRVVDSRLLAASCFAGLSSIWRHSAKIGRDGFLMNNFPIQGVSMDMAVRQVNTTCSFRCYISNVAVL